ncbi:hypothetical protein CK203_010485 [Vitis vinifera]|uniref:Late embryogenesis abundant protein LEA-2 subgroup domain-containing protein n=1 Tax=Vitis vinifera TaxID=29760 RepID=A0A438JTR9_VITVI|nr:hypothetical protein CK203_010485 [Vitis vinifera]
MAVTMHAKSDSEVTSLDASSPPRSPRRPLYYVQSPSQHDVEKMSYGSSPLGSPHHYHCSPIHHSRESSTSRFSASVKNSKHASAWKKIHRDLELRAAADAEDDDDDDDDFYTAADGRVRLYLCLAFAFVVLFTVFSLILWGAGRSYKPKIIVEVQCGIPELQHTGGDGSNGSAHRYAVADSTIRISYRNPATFFGVHVSSTPVEFYYYQLKVVQSSAERPIMLTYGYSGQSPYHQLYMKEFYQSRKSQRSIVMVVLGHQVPLYGGVSVVGGAKDHLEKVAVPLNLTFVMRSRGYILGRLVKVKFLKSIRCPVILRGDRLAKPLKLVDSCIYK